MLSPSASDFPEMELISLPASPFAARVRMAIYAKGLPVEITAPPSGWPRNRQFRDISPTGRIPVLLFGDTAIWESAVILEFLEDQFPETPRLMPAAPRDRAQVRLLMRHVDLYLMPPMSTLAEPRLGEAEARRAVAALADALALLDEMLPVGAYAVTGELTLADCALAPALLAARVTSDRLGVDLIAAAPAVADYVDNIRLDDRVARVLDEMEEGMAALVRVD